jgi:hypothetical protein
MSSRFLQALLAQNEVWKLPGSYLGRTPISTVPLVGLFACQRQELLFSYSGSALLARNGLRVLCCDALDFRAVGRFTVARITRDHAVLVQKVQVSFLALSPTPCRHQGSPECIETRVSSAKY